MSDEPLSALTLSEVPEPEGLIPTGRQQMVVVAGQADVADEVGVAGQALPGLGELGSLLELTVELPDDDGLVPGPGDKDLGVLVLLDGVPGGDAGDPSVVALEVASLLELYALFSVCHIR